MPWRNVPVYRTASEEETIALGARLAREIPLNRHSMAHHQTRKIPAPIFPYPRQVPQNRHKELV